MSHKEIEEALLSGSAYVNRCVVHDKTTYHTHDFVEIAYVASGTGLHTVNGMSHKTFAGDVFLINYDIPHEFVTTGEPLTVYNCIFTPAYFNATLNKSRDFFDITDHFLLSNLYSNLPTDYLYASSSGNENQHIFNIYNRLLQEFTAKQIGYRDIMRGYIIELLVIICRLKLSVDSTKTQKMLEVLEYVNVHYREDVRIDRLAALAGFSESHFRRVFKELTGKTLTLYLQALRIEEACKLLKDHTMSVEQVAAAVGYNDMKHFYAVFKRISGQTPKTMR